MHVITLLVEKPHYRIGKLIVMLCYCINYITNE